MQVGQPQIFPLRGTAFEQYMLADDRDSHPMSAFMQLDIAGSLTDHAIIHGLQSSLQRHPLMRSVVKYSQLGVPYWHPTALPQPDIADISVPVAFSTSERIDLTSEPGLRCWVRRGPEKIRIVIQVHHACSDALGKLTFLRDWLMFSTSQTLPEMSVPTSLHERGVIPTPTDINQKSLKSLGIFEEWYRFLAGRTERLAGERHRNSDRVTLPGLYQTSIEDDVFQSIRTDARRRKLSINDWLVSALFVATSSWSLQQRGTWSQRVCRIIMPFNMRPKTAIGGSACNQIGYEILSQRVTRKMTFDDLCQRVSRYTEPVRVRRTSTFCRMLRRVAKIPALIPLITNSPKSFGTVVFSNLGDVSRLFDYVETEDGCWNFGDLKVEDIQCAPPTRPETHLAIVAMRYGGRLHLSTRCEGRELSSQAISDFLEHYRNTIEGLVESESPAAQPAEPPLVTEAT